MTFTGDIRNVTNDTQFDNFNTSQIVYLKNQIFPANGSPVSHLHK